MTFTHLRYRPVRYSPAYPNTRVLVTPVRGTSRTSTLYDKLGGKDAVKVATDRFYERIVGDAQVAHFFEGLDMKTQRAKQVGFLTFALGGADTWTGRSMSEAHRGLHLTNEHFDVIAKHFEETLVELNVAPDTIQEALEVLASTRADVIAH